MESPTLSLMEWQAGPESMRDIWRRCNSWRRVRKAEGRASTFWRTSGQSLEATKTPLPLSPAPRWQAARTLSSARRRSSAGEPFATSSESAQRKGTGASTMMSSTSTGQIVRRRCCQPKGQSKAVSPSTIEAPKEGDGDRMSTFDSNIIPAKIWSTRSTSKLRKSWTLAPFRRTSSFCSVSRSKQPPIKGKVRGAGYTNAEKSRLPGIVCCPERWEELVVRVLVAFMAD
mmetsp:Transcript_68275/g.142699  ORF Transcript_68275/g.142699 Transcript_68275/m.142699 type:complete len:229 (+) Transcript_68275:713-1399(+)